MFCVSEQRLGDQENTVHMNRWMIEEEIEKLKRAQVEDHGLAGEAPQRSVKMKI